MSSVLPFLDDDAATSGNDRGSLDGQDQAGKLPPQRGDERPGRNPFLPSDDDSDADVDTLRRKLRLANTKLERAYAENKKLWADLNAARDARDLAEESAAQDRQSAEEARASAQLANRDRMSAMEALDDQMDMVTVQRR